MSRYILSRLFQALPVLLIVITATFFLVRAAPGGPFDDERVVSPDVLKNLNERYNLNDPVSVQYLKYLAGLLKGDLGPSYKFPARSVNELIASGLPITFELAIYALIVALIIGLVAGIIAALRMNTKWDYGPMALAMIGICLPSFVLGPILVLVFGIKLEWLPVTGWGSLPGDKVLPSITLGAAYAAYIARITRGSMIEVLSQDFIRTARAKGLSQKRIVVVHALRAAIPPVISFLGPALAGLLAGSFVVETIFQIPGLGRFYVEAAFNRDYTMILGTTIFFSVMIVAFNLLADILLAWFNPRLRIGLSS